MNLLFSPPLFCHASAAVLLAIGISASVNVRADGRPDIVWMRGGHSASVRTVAYSPDGATFVTASDDWTAKVWRVSDRQLLHTLVPYTASCSSVGFSADGRLLAVGSDVDEGNDTFAIKVYETVGFSEVFTRVFENEVRFGAQALAFSPNGVWLAVAGSERITLFRTNDWSDVRTLVLPDGGDVAFHSLVFSVDATKLLAAMESNDNAALAVWQLSDGALCWATNAPGNSGGPAAFAPGNEEIIWGLRARWPEESGSAQIRSAGDGRFDRYLTATNVIGISLSPDGLTFALASWFAPLQVWDWPAENLRYEIPDSWNESVTFSPNGQSFAAGLRIWRTSDGQPQPGFDGHFGKIEKIVFSPDNSLLASGGSDYTVRLWRVATGEQIAVLHQGYVITALAFSPDSSLVVASGGTDLVGLWSTNGMLIRNLNHPFAYVRDAAFSSNGNFVAVAYAGETVVFDVASGNRATNGPPPETFQLGRQGAVSPAGHSASYTPCCPTCSYGTCGLMLAGQVLEVSSDATPRAMAFAADSGTLLVAGSFTTLNFWGTTSYQLAQTYTEEVAGGAPYFLRNGDDRVIGRWRGATAVAYSRDGHYFAYGRVDGTVVLARNQFDTPVEMSARSEGNAMRLSWRGGNRYYVLQRKNDIGPGEWQTISPAITTTNALVIPGVGSNAFYRVLNLGN